MSGTMVALSRAEDSQCQHTTSHIVFFAGTPRGDGVALAAADSEADIVAQKQGLFTILATGNGAVITNEEDFKAKEW